MRHLKKIIPVCLLALLLVIGVTALSPKVQAASSGTCGDNLIWTLDDAGTLTISGTGPMENYTWKGSPWYNNSAIAAIVIEPGVTTIGNSAFRNCDSLTSITIPDGITSIGESAFCWCLSLQSVTIGSGVTTIGNYAFWDCYSLQIVYYAGTQAQWNKISIGSYNSDLTSATIYYNHIHDYTLIPPTILVEATCTEKGSMEYTCLYGETYRESIPALGHSKGEDTVIIVPTCTEQGYTQSTCTRCGEAAKTDYIDALDHDYTGPEKTIDATCTAEGYSGVSCTRCDSFRQDQTIDALGHNAVVIALRDPTCTEQGVIKVGTMCDRCEEVFVQPTYTPALGHNYVDGTCSRCQEADPDYNANPGDLTGDNQTNNEDVVLLLWHTLFPEDYPLTVDADLNGDSNVNNDDVVLLLWHTLFPEDYPL